MQYYRKQMKHTAKNSLIRAQEREREKSELNAHDQKRCPYQIQAKGVATNGNQLNLYKNNDAAINLQKCKQNKLRMSILLLEIEPVAQESRKSTPVT